MSVDPSLYLFDGSNLFHAGTFRDRDELTDLLASFVALRGAPSINPGYQRRASSLIVDTSTDR